MLTTQVCNSAEHVPNIQKTLGLIPQHHRKKHSYACLWFEHFRSVGRINRNSRPSSTALSWVWGQPGLHKTLSQKRKIKKMFIELVACVCDSGPWETESEAEWLKTRLGYTAWPCLKETWMPRDSPYRQLALCHDEADWNVNDLRRNESISHKHLWWEPGRQLRR